MRKENEREKERLKKDKHVSGHSGEPPAPSPLQNTPFTHLRTNGDAGEFNIPLLELLKALLRTLRVPECDVLVLYKFVCFVTTLIRSVYRQTDRQRDKQTDKRTDRQTNRLPDRRTDLQTNEQTYKQTNGRTDKRIYRQTHGHTDRRTSIRFGVTFIKRWRLT